MTSPVVESGLATLLRWRRDVRHVRPDPLADGVMSQLVAAADLAPIASARAAWGEVAWMIPDPASAMVIADELNIVLRHDYLPLDEVLAAVRGRAPMKHVVVTDRNALAALIESADLVTEMALVKRPYREQGVKAQAAIEFQSDAIDRPRGRRYPPVCDRFPGDGD